MMDGYKCRKCSLLQIKRYLQFWKIWYKKNEPNSSTLMKTDLYIPLLKKKNENIPQREIKIV